VDNTDDKASLIPGTAYRIIPEPRVAEDILVRTVDERGEEYRSRKSVFVFIKLPRAIAKKNRSLEAA
jgi:hypothetical protein